MIRRRGRRWERGPTEPAGKSEEISQQISGLTAELELREQILSSMAEGVVLVDARGRVAYFNPAAASMLNSSMTLPVEVLRGDQSEFTAGYPAKRTLQTSLSTLADGSRLVVIQDVTESRRVDSMRRDFVANVSHELKTPVAGILASAETLDLSAEEDPASAGRFARSLFNEARRLSRLVEDLLDLARLETDQAASFETVNLSDAVSAEVAKTSEFAARKGLHLEADVGPGIIVRGVAESIALAVRNLLSNAVRYTEQGTLKVSLKPKDGSAVFAVSDTGVGIPAKDLPRIFERFYRVDKARSRETGGTGLGLSIVKHVAEIHGGEVHAESQLGSGSDFTLVLPLEPAPRRT
ncbi:MAG: sensor histidine kinase [Actinomycetota bacterium]